MPESAQTIDLGCSTADAEYPSFALREGVATIEFVDWQDRPVRLQFLNAAALKWEEIASPGPEPRDDQTYEIIGSAWIDAHLADGSRTGMDGLRHFRLCFNACGVLDVLAQSVKAD